MDRRYELMENAVRDLRGYNRRLKNLADAEAAALRAGRTPLAQVDDGSAEVIESDIHAPEVRPEPVADLPRETTVHRRGH